MISKTMHKAIIFLLGFVVTATMANPLTYLLYKYGHSMALINFQVESAVAYHLLNIHYNKLQFYPSNLT